MDSTMLCSFLHLYLMKPLKPLYAVPVPPFLFPCSHVPSRSPSNSRLSLLTSFYSKKSKKQKIISPCLFKRRWRMFQKFRKRTFQTDWFSTKFLPLFIHTLSFLFIFSLAFWKRERAYVKQLLTLGKKLNAKNVWRGNVRSLKHCFCSFKYFCLPISLAQHHLSAAPIPHYYQYHHHQRQRQQWQQLWCSTGTKSFQLVMTMVMIMMTTAEEVCKCYQWCGFFVAVKC